MPAEIQEETTKRELKRALGMALESNILKQDSALSINLAETWAAHASFEEVLQKFKNVLTQNQDNVPPEIMSAGEKLESASSDLKNCVTSAIKCIEETKINIIKILEEQDSIMLHKA